MRPHPLQQRRLAVANVATDFDERRAVPPHAGLRQPRHADVQQLVCLYRFQQLCRCGCQLLPRDVSIRTVRLDFHVPALEMLTRSGVDVVGRKDRFVRSISWSLGAKR